MLQQRRCLTGMTNGLPINLPLSSAAATIHTFDNPPTGDQSGRPVLHQLALWIQNTSDTEVLRAQVEFDPADGSASILMEVQVQFGEIVKVFDDTVFGGQQAAPEGAGTLKVGYVAASGFSTQGTAWGWFVATQG
jgi:hypothetical protein